MNGPYTIILTVIDARQDQTFFHRKKGFSLYPLFFELFSRPSFSAELYAHPSVAVLVELHFKTFPEISIRI